MFSGFHHLAIYEISYMWFSAIPTVVCFVVGASVSMARQPQDPKVLNPALISPGFKGFFAYWPRRVRRAIDNVQLGSKYVSHIIIIANW